VGLEAISRRALLWGAGGSAFASLAGCKVVPIAEGGAPAGGFDAKTWAADLWSSKVLPYFATQAKPLADVLKALAGDLDEAGKQYGYRP
jgi:predicted lipoprotein